MRHLIVDTIKSVIVWDEKKRLQDLEKHQLDFADAGLVFDDPDKITLPSPRRGEIRCLDITHVNEVGMILAFVVCPAGRGDTSDFVSNRFAPGKETL